jgi:PAT family beta-lactamase induction signal transducer AmpG
MVYMMRCCQSEFKAAHMAILTALMSVGFTVAGVSSGFLAEWLGFTHYFLFSFLATIPGMMLLPFIPYLDGKTAAKPA